MPAILLCCHCPTLPTNHRTCLQLTPRISNGLQRNLSALRRHLGSCARAQLLPTAILVCYAIYYSILSARICTTPSRILAESATVEVLTQYVGPNSIRLFQHTKWKVSPFVVSFDVQPHCVGDAYLNSNDPFVSRTWLSPIARAICAEAFYQNLVATLLFSISPPRAALQFLRNINQPSDQSSHLRLHLHR
jgi:hypothetical protein